MSLSKSHHWEKVAVFAFGVVFITALLAVALFFKDFTPESYSIFRIIIALAAAGIGAVIPGFLDVQMKGFLRAGGAMALFVIVYFFSPPPPIAPPPPPNPNAAIEKLIDKVEPQTSARPTAEEWMNLIDRFQYEQAWDTGAKSMQYSYSRKGINDVFTETRTPLGTVRVRRPQGVDAMTQLPNGIKGHFRTFKYQTTFESGSTYDEYVMMVAENGEWKTLAHTIHQTPAFMMPSAMAPAAAAP